MTVVVYISNPTEWWKQPGSKLIRYVDKTPGSHCSIGLITHTGEKVYESVWPRSKRSTKAEWLEHNIIIKKYEFEIPPEIRFDVYSWLEKSVGIKYSIPQLFLILADLIKPANYRDLNGHSQLICSELVGVFLNKFLAAKLDETVDTIGVLDVIVLCEMLSA